MVYLYAFINSNSDDEAGVNKMDFRKFRLICGGIALSLIVSGCTNAKEEKAAEGASGKLVVESETTAAPSTASIREYILKDSSNMLLSPQKIGSLDNRILEGCDGEAPSDRKGTASYSNP